MSSSTFARMLRPRFTTLAGLTLVAFAGVVVSVVALVDAGLRFEAAEEARLQSERLSHELRQSSDDLTRMVRVYVATGDLRYRRRYQEILDIRDGRAPRPGDYDKIYWDLVLDDDRRPTAGGSAMPLLEMMRRAGFTPTEFDLLARSKAASDELTYTEFAAMALVDAGPSTPPETRLRAIARVHDAAYLKAKAAIMAPLREFDLMADQRTSRAVRQARQRAMTTLAALVAFGVLLGVTLLNLRRHLRNVLGGSAEAVLEGVSRLGRGDFSTPSPQAAHEDSVLGWIGRTREDLARLDADRLRAEETLRESERRFHQALDVMMEGCMLIDFDWTYLYVNEVAAGHAQRPRDALVGRRMHEVFPGIRATPVFASLLFVMERRQPRRVEESHTFEDGRTRWYEFSIVPIAEGIFVLSLDITERRELARRLSAVNADLERQVAERTSDLQAALDAARQASQAKSAFLSHMSHELRTPMNAILGFSQLLMLEKLQDDQRHRVELIEQAGRHLLTLIDELLDLTRIESGRTRVTLAPVEVDRLVADALALVRPLVAQRRLEVVDATPPGVRVRADAMRLRQVAVNVLSNAAKYNREGGRITIDATTTADEWLSIAVRDTGVGIAPEDLPRLFRPFERLEGTRYRVDGTGIGLALSRHLVELMGGRVTVESVPGVGSVFRIELPIVREDGSVPGVPPEEAPDDVRADAPADVAAEVQPEVQAEVQADVQDTAPTAPSPEAPAVAKRPFEVLYVEDQQQNIDLVAALFARRPGWRLTTARSGDEGLALARHVRPDAVLLDIHLPVLDGFQVLAALREGAATRDLPVIALSADAMPEQVQRGLAAGFLEYLTKPLDLARLLARLDELAAARR